MDLDPQWVKVRSWHVMATPTRMPDTYRTLCGRLAKAPVLDVRPGHEKTCELCLRLITKKQ